MYFPMVYLLLVKPIVQTPEQTIDAKHCRAYLESSRALNFATYPEVDDANFVREERQDVLNRRAVVVLQYLDCLLDVPLHLDRVALDEQPNRFLLLRVCTNVRATESLYSTVASWTVE